jgi:hypothetical protein
MAFESEIIPYNESFEGDLSFLLLNLQHSVAAFDSLHMMEEFEYMIILLQSENEEAYGVDET